MRLKVVSNRTLTAAAITALAVAVFALRIWDIQNHFWMLGDQIRDWGIALEPFWRLPLVGPATHVHGYTIGPAFYWILWAIRVVLGPFFENLPHAGGIGQAALATAADALLLMAVWRRTRSPWIAGATFIMIVTSAYNLSLVALVWNPTMGTTLATTATALVLLNWHRGSLVRLAVVAAVAWCAIHAYTGAVFVALSVLLALFADTWLTSGRRAAWRALAVLAAVIAALQLPYVAHQIMQRFNDPAMSAVTGGVGEILSGRAAPRFLESLAGYRDAIDHNTLAPRSFPWLGWVLAGGGLVTAWRFRRDPQLLLVILLPQVAAVVGFAFFLGYLDPYYYLSLTPAAVLTVLLPFAGIRWAVARYAVGGVVLVSALWTMPGRIEHSRGHARLPEYRTLVAASRTVRNARRPFRAIVTDFPLPPSCDPDFLYRVLGGKMDRSSPWVAVISRDGTIKYINNDLNKGRLGQGGS